MNAGLNPCPAYVRARARRDSIRYKLVRETTSPHTEWRDYNDETLSMKTIPGTDPMQVRQQVREYLLKNHVFNMDAAALHDEVSLINGGVIDSIGVLELITFLEERFGIEMEEEEMVPDNLDTVVSIEAFVARKRGRLPA
jgi:acyl carrier protein